MRLLLLTATPQQVGRDFDVAHVDYTEMDLQFVDDTHGRNMKKACVFFVELINFLAPHFWMIIERL